jgi:hypothetical protein
MEARGEVISLLRCGLKMYDNLMAKFGKRRFLLAKYGVACPSPCTCPSVERGREVFLNRLQNVKNLNGIDPGDWYEDMEVPDLTAIIDDVRHATEMNGQILSKIQAQGKEIRALEERLGTVRSECAFLHRLYIALMELFGGEAPSDDFPDLAFLEVDAETVEQLRERLSAGENLPDRCKAAIAPFVAPLAQRIRELPTAEELQGQLPEPPADGTEDKFSGIRQRLAPLAPLRRLFSTRPYGGPMAFARVESLDDARSFLKGELGKSRLFFGIECMKLTNKAQADIAAVLSGDTA